MFPIILTFNEVFNKVVVSLEQQKLSILGVILSSFSSFFYMSTLWDVFSKLRHRIMCSFSYKMEECVQLSTSCDMFSQLQHWILCSVSYIKR